MVVRVWGGSVRHEQIAAYLAFFQHEQRAMLERIPGFVRADLLRRDTPDGADFVVQTYWETETAIVGWSGADAEAAVIPARVAELMERYDARAHHYTIVPR